MLVQLADWAMRFSPVVQPVGPHALWLDITGCAHLFRGEAHLARQALGGLLRQGYEVRAAVADTPGAAHALAAAGRESLTLVPPGQTSAWLAPLPAAALRLDPRNVEQLDRIGVRTVGDLLMLPRAALLSRFGEGLVQRLHQALGEIFEGVTPQRIVEPPSAAMGFEHPLRSLPPLEHIANDLLRSVAAQVEQRCEAVRRLDAFVYHEDGGDAADSRFDFDANGGRMYSLNDATTFSAAAAERCPEPTQLNIRLARESRAWRHIGELLRQRLAAVDLGPGICGLRLIAAETGRWRPEQQELEFEENAEEENADRGMQNLERGNAQKVAVSDQHSQLPLDALAALIDTLANRLGYAAVVRSRLLDDHQPELAYRYVSVVETGLTESAELGVRGSAEEAAIGNKCGSGTEGIQNPKSKIQNPTDVAGLSRLAARPVPPAPRPILLFRRPIPVRTMAVFPDGPPTWFEHGGTAHRIVHAAGPERIETAWWRGADVRRDYYRVTSETGAQFWLFREGVERQWFVQGVFA